MMSLIPIASLHMIKKHDANELLERWGHKMGPINRGNSVGWSHALFHGDEPVAVVVSSSLIRECVGGGLGHLTRDNTIELSRLCASRPGICRIALRMWREFIFPSLGYQFAISYQDAKLHSGNIYRFDGWTRAAYSRSGTDSRSGRKGRTKWIWLWPPQSKAK